MISTIKRYGILFFSIMILSGTFTVAGATEVAKDHFEALKYYQQGDYEKSAELMEQIAERGISNGKLYYNLGNAFFKAGKTGHAVLWYERALKHIPNDPDLKYNYNYVKGFVKDSADEKGLSVVGILFFWKSLLGRNLIQMAGLACLFIFCLIASIRIYKNRKIFKIHTTILFIVSLTLILTSVYDFYVDNYIKRAVVIPDEIQVRSGLSSDSTELFQLHTGTCVRIEDERKGYVKVRLSDDKIGWTERENLEKI